VGTGYVGLVTGLCLAELGNDVVCIDVIPEKIEAIRNGKAPIYEPGVEELLEKHLRSGRFRATLDMGEAASTDITFIAVGTPSRADGSLDLGYISSAADGLGRALASKDGYHVVVVKSTVTPTTTDRLVGPALEKASGKRIGDGIGLASNPEFLKEGMAVKDFMEPDRVVIGASDEHAAAVVRTLYEPLDRPVLVVPTATAEMIKVASNSFLATKISFVNEVGNICKDMGIDMRQVAEGMGMDKRIGPQFLRAGCGFGGSCFPKDVAGLAAEAERRGLQPRLMRAALEVNAAQPARLLEQLDRRRSVKRPPGGSAWPCLQALHRRHPGSVIAESGGRPAGKRRVGQVLRPQGHGQLPQGVSRPVVLLLRPGMRRRRRGGAHRHRMAGVRPRRSCTATGWWWTGGGSQGPTITKEYAGDGMKAVIPAAGMGVRFLPLTKNMPKEMLPVVHKPTIQYVVEEAVAAGIDDILIITGRGKRSLEDHFDHSFELEQALEHNGRQGDLDEIRRIVNMANIHYVRQKSPRGLGDAVLLAKQHVGDEPFAVMLGDTINVSAVPVVKQLMDVQRERGGSVIAVEPVPLEKVRDYGIIKGKKIAERLYEVEGLVEKPLPQDAPSDLGITGTYVLSPRIFDCIERTPPGRGGEVQLTDALRLLGKEEALYGLQFEGVRYDIGDKLGWLKTTMHLALEDPELGEPLRKYLSDLMSPKG